MQAKFTISSLLEMILALANSMLEAHIDDKEDDVDYEAIIEKKCREVERHRTKLSNFIDMRAEGEIDKESYTKKTAEVKEEIAKLSAEIEELQLKLNKEPVITDYRDKLTVLQYALEQYTKLFNVSINELLSGKRLTQEEYKVAAEENLRQVVKVSSFTLKEKVAFYKKKWLKEHIVAMCCWGIGIITVLVIGIILTLPLFVAAAILLLLIGHAWRNNTMMAYVERNAFDGTERND